MYIQSKIKIQVKLNVMTDYNNNNIPGIIKSFSIYIQPNAEELIINPYLISHDVVYNLYNSL